MNRFTIVEQIDSTQWERFVLEHPKGSVFHTPAMVEVFRRTKNYYPFVRAAVDPAGDIVALLVAVRIQTLPSPLGPFSSRSILHAEPLCRPVPLGVEAMTALLAEHDNYMKNRALFTEVRPLQAAGSEEAALACQGYDHKRYLNFVIDLSQPAAKLRGDMTKSCRGNIRRSEKQGVTVEETTKDGLEEIHRLLRQTYERAGVPMADRSLFAAAFDVLWPREMLKACIAYWDGKPVGANLLLLHKETAFDWYRGLARIGSIYPGESLVWHEIQWAQAHGYRVFDFGGAGWPDVPYGVRDFKAKFGGQLVDHGRYRKVYSATRLALAEKAYELSRTIRGIARRGMLRRQPEAAPGGRSIDPAEIGAKGRAKAP
jgi:serine/alanine adding enzyme